MPDSAVATFTDPDAYHAAIRDVQAQGVVSGRGDFRADFATIRLDRLSLQRAKETLPRVTYSAVDPKQFGIVFVTHPGPASIHQRPRIIARRGRCVPRGIGGAQSILGGPSMGLHRSDA